MDTEGIGMLGAALGKLIKADPKINQEFLAELHAGKVPTVDPYLAPTSRLKKVFGNNADELNMAYAANLANKFAGRDVESSLIDKRAGAENWLGDEAGKRLLRDTYAKLGIPEDQIDKAVGHTMELRKAGVKTAKAGARQAGAEATDAEKKVSWSKDKPFAAALQQAGFIQDLGRTKESGRQSRLNIKESGRQEAASIRERAGMESVLAKERMENQLQLAQELEYMAMRNPKFAEELALLKANVVRAAAEGRIAGIESRERADTSVNRVAAQNALAGNSILASDLGLKLNQAQLDLLAPKLRSAKAQLGMLEENPELEQAITLEGLTGLYDQVLPTGSTMFNRVLQQHGAGSSVTEKPGPATPVKDKSGKVIYSIPGEPVRSVVPGYLSAPGFQLGSSQNQGGNLDVPGGSKPPMVGLSTLTSPAKMPTQENVLSGLISMPGMSLMEHLGISAAPERMSQRDFDALSPALKAQIWLNRK